MKSILEVLSVLIFNMVNINKYRPYMQKLFEVPDNY